MLRIFPHILPFAGLHFLLKRCGKSVAVSRFNYAFEMFEYKYRLLVGFSKNFQNGKEVKKNTIIWYKIFKGVPKG